MNRCSMLRLWAVLSFLMALLVGGTASPAAAQGPTGKVKGHSLKELMSSGGYAALQQLRAARAAAGAPGKVGLRALAPVPGNDEEEGGAFEDGSSSVTDHSRLGEAPMGAGSRGRPFGRNGQFQNAFVNDPCLDPPPTTPIPADNDRVVQSETEIAVLSSVGDGDDNDESDDDRGGGRLMVAGYNDSYGFYNNQQGLSGFSYSTDGGKSWIDASGLPPIIKSSAPAGTPGSDAYAGDPVVAVHHRTKLFYFASIYLTPNGFQTLAVNRGRFRVAPRQVPVESKANTRCAGNNAAFGIPDPPAFVRERIIWDPPVVAVPTTFLGPDADHSDGLDKEWLYVDQNTGVLYLTYTRFSFNDETPIELVRSFDQGQTWTPPTVIVPNLFDTFNQATMPVVTPTGRVIVTWHARTFPAPTFVEREQRIEAGFSDNCRTPTDLCTFGPPVIVSIVNPQGEPPGYNRARATILNAPYINVDKGRDDGKFTKGEKKKPGFGNVYITYFNGKTALAPAPNPGTSVFLRAADIFLSTSRNNGTTYDPRKKVNDDNTQTSHVFPSVQVNKKALVFVTWLDRRVDPEQNFLTDTWGDISRNQGASLGGDVRITDVSTDWFVRADAAPNFGDYNSSELINFKDFVSIWADGRFPPPTAPITCTPAGVCSRPRNDSATPDTFFEIFGDGSGHGDDGHGHGGD
jgi:hypothetical protein